MAISDLVGKVFSSQFLAGVQQNTPILSLASDRSSEVQAKGDGLIVALTQGLTSVADYPSDGSDITYSKLAPQKTELSLDKEKYVAFEVEDIDTAQLAFNLFSEGARQAGVTFAKQLNDDLKATIAGATPAQKSEIELAANSSTPAERQALNLLMLDMKSKLVTDGYDGRPVVLMHPSTWKLLMQYVTIDKGMSFPSTSQTAFVEGTLSALYGMDIIVDWNAAIDSTNDNDDANSYALIRSRTLTYAGQLSKIEQMRSDGRFASRWRGLQTYGSIIQETRSLLKLEQTVK